VIGMTNSSPLVRLRDDPDRLLSYDEAGELADVPSRTVRKWVAEGNGPRVIQLGRHRRIRLSDWLAWLDTRYVDAA
jgi:excisionase family DNA binding protein